jgi:hypothetical protein
LNELTYSVVKTRAHGDTDGVWDGVCVCVADREGVAVVDGDLDSGDAVGETVGVVDGVDERDPV